MFALGLGKHAAARTNPALDSVSVFCTFAAI